MRTVGRTWEDPNAPTMKRNLLPLALAILSVTSIALGLILASQEPQGAASEVAINTLSDSGSDLVCLH